MTVRGFLFHGDGGDAPFDLAAEGGHGIAKEELLWLDVSAIDEREIATICNALGLSDRAVSALERELAESRATVMADAVEVVVLALVDGLDREPTPLQVLVGRGWIITRHAEPMPFLDERRETIRDDRPVGRLSSVQFLVSLLDWHVDTFFRAAEELEEAVDRLDDAALRTDGGLLHRLVRMRRRIARVRHILNKHREIFAELSRPDFLPDLEPDDQQALAGVARRLDRAGEAVSHTREMLLGTFDIHMTRTAQRTNDIMRVLTLASVILLPSVVIAGVMGMNFRVGFFDEPNMFWVVIGAMAFMALGTLGVARWRGWL